MTPRSVTPRLRQEVLAICGCDTNARRALATRQCQGNFRSRGAGFPDAAKQIREIRHRLASDFENNIPESYPGPVRRTALRELRRRRDCPAWAWCTCRATVVGCAPARPSFFMSSRIGSSRSMGTNMLASMVSAAHGLLHQERANSEQTSVLPDERRAAPLRMRWRCEQRVFQQVLPVARELAPGDDFRIERVLDTAVSDDDHAVAHRSGRSGTPLDGCDIRDDRAAGRVQSR